MHRYFIRTPWIVKRLFPDYIWSLPPGERSVFLTFDDGPHPVITPWVLEQLKQAGAKASFFCIGENVKKYPEVYQQILDEGHVTGNHTNKHLNGWHTKDAIYLDDIRAAQQQVKSNLFRPPYGRIRSSQARQLPSAMETKEARVIMWDVLSGDFDATFSGRQCLTNVTGHVRDGSIVVFHDSEKAERHLRYALPGALEFLLKEDYILKGIHL